MKLESCTILLVEDNPGDAHLVKKLLHDGATAFGVSKINVVHVAQLSMALDSVSKNNFEAIILDLSLPDSHGLEAVTRLSVAAPTTPIIVFTGTEDSATSLQALHEGAQDYLLKNELDFKTITKAILFAIERKRTEIHRLEESLKSQVTAAHLSKIKNGNIELNLLNQTMVVLGSENSQTISLPPREFKLLLYLLKNEGKVVAREEILAHVWNEEDSKPNPRCIDTLVSSLKKKSKVVEDRIESIYGAGYRINRVS